MIRHVRCPTCERYFDIQVTDLQLSTGPTSTVTERAVAWLCRVAEVLREKGRKYGNSLDQPMNVFSRLNALEGVNVRIDDKIKRIKTSEPDDNEDAELDLVGYIALRQGLKNES